MENENGIGSFLNLTKESGRDFGLALWFLVYSIKELIVSVLVLLNPVGPTGRFAFALGGWVTIFGVGFIIITTVAKYFKLIKGV